MANNVKKLHKRRKYFIEKNLQSRFILKFCLVVVAAGLLTIGILYFLAKQSTTVSIVNSRVMVTTTADFILPILVQTVVIVSIIASLVTIIIALFYSHKIAGPLYRFKKAIQALEEGDLSSDFHIRHLDHLQDLSSTFNSMIKKLRNEQSQLKSNIQALKERLSDISEQEVLEPKRPALKELKRLSQELDKIINYFKT